MTPRRLKSPASRGYRANASANSREAPDRSPFSMADWMASIIRSTSRFWLRRGNRAQSNTPASAATRIGPIVSQGSGRQVRPAYAVLTSSTSSEVRSEEHTSELQSLRHLVCRLLLEKKTEDTP